MKKKKKSCAKLPFQNGAPIQRATLNGALEWKHRPFYGGRAPFGCPLSPGARGFAYPESIGVTPLWVCVGVGVCVVGWGCELGCL